MTPCTLTTFRMYLYSRRHQLAKGTRFSKAPWEATKSKKRQKSSSSKIWYDTDATDESREQQQHQVLQGKFSKSFSGTHIYMVHNFVSLKNYSVVSSSIRLHKVWQPKDLRTMGKLWICGKNSSNLFLLLCRS